jgi:phosphatidylglycerol:prolipoprotein diacylglycerol transferase
MLPELFTIGPLHVRSFGLMLALAFVVGAWLALGEARRKGVDESKLLNLVLVILVSSIVGARAFYVITHPQELAGDPFGAFRLWEGGLTLIGGFVLGTIGGFAYMRWAGLPPHLTADVLAPSVALGSGIARFGCFLNGCCFGVPGHAPWCVRFPADSAAGMQFPGQALEPSQLYNVAAGVLLFVVLLWLRPRLRVPGQLWWTFVLLFSLVRLPIDQTRYYEPSAYVIRWGSGGLTDSELIGLALAAFSIFMLVVLQRRRRTDAADAAA